MKSIDVIRIRINTIMNFIDEGKTHMSSWDVFLMLKDIEKEIMRIDNQ